MRNRPPDKFVERLTELIDEAERLRGISLVRLAEDLGVDRSQIYRWRNGERSPEGSNVAAIADYFGVTMDWLWGRTNIRNVNRVLMLYAGTDDVEGDPFIRTIDRAVTELAREFPPGTRWTLALQRQLTEEWRAGQPEWKAAAARRRLMERFAAGLEEAQQSASQQEQTEQVPRARGRRAG